MQILKYSSHNCRYSTSRPTSNCCQQRHEGQPAVNCMQTCRCGDIPSHMEWDQRVMRKQTAKNMQVKST